MEENILKTMMRTESPKKVRKAGFIPGVLNESDTTSTSVQFEAVALHKIVSHHGSNAKVWVELGSGKKFGFIKEIQKSPLDRNIVHVSIQLVSLDQDVKMQLPITYHGREDLEYRMLHVQVYKTEIDVSGRANAMPDKIIVDVTGKEEGDMITAADLSLSADITVLDDDNEIYAVIKPTRVIKAEEPEEAAPEAVAETAAAE